MYMTPNLTSAAFQEDAGSFWHQTTTSTKEAPRPSFHLRVVCACTMAVTALSARPSLGVSKAIYVCRVVKTCH